MGPTKYNAKAAFVFYLRFFFAKKPFFPNCTAVVDWHVDSKQKQVLLLQKYTKIITKTTANNLQNYNKNNK